MESKAKIISDAFQILAKVLQGDILSPFLCLIVLDYVLRQALQDYQVPFCDQNELSSFSVYFRIKKKNR